MSYKHQNAVLDLIKYNPKKFAYKAGTDTIEFDEDFKLPPYFADIANKNLKAARKEVKAINPFASIFSWIDASLCGTALAFALVFICIKVLGNEMTRLPDASTSFTSIFEKMQAASKYITWPLILFGLLGMPLKRIQYAAIDGNGFFQRANKNISKLGIKLCRYKEEEELIDLSSIYNMNTLEIKDDYENAIADKKFKNAFIEFKKQYNRQLLDLQVKHTDLMLDTIPRLMEFIILVNESVENKYKNTQIRELKQQLDDLREILVRKEKLDKKEKELRRYKQWIN